MTVNAKVSVFDLVEEANKVIDTLPVDQAVAMHGDPDVVFVDLRDVRELEREGRIPGAFHMPRGMGGVLGRSPQPVLQARHLRRRQAIRVLLQQGLAFGAGHRGRAAHRSGAGVSRRGRVHRLEGSRRTDRGLRAPASLTRRGLRAIDGTASRKSGSREPRTEDRIRVVRGSGPSWLCRARVCGAARRRCARRPGDGPWCRESRAENRGPRTGIEWYAVPGRRGSVVRECAAQRGGDALDAREIVPFELRQRHHGVETGHRVRSVRADSRAHARPPVPRSPPRTRRCTALRARRRAGRCDAPSRVPCPCRRG